MRVFLGGLVTETNTFSPFPLGRSGFEEVGIRHDNSTVEGPVSGPVRVWRTMAERDGHEVIESILAAAQTAGSTVRATYEELRDILLSDLESAPPADIVLLFLHGAMVADGYDDCEGDILRRVRSLRPDAVIGAVLDPHCHLTTEMIERADILITAKEYPHIDFSDRAVEVYDIAAKIASGDVEPVAVMIDMAMIGGYATLQPPGSEIVAELKEAEKADNVLSVTLAHGFPWGDVADVGTRMLVYTDRAEEFATAEARRLARRIYDRRHDLVRKAPDIAESLDRFAELEGRVVLGDAADNAGAGAPSDSTFFLRALLDRGITDAVIGAFWDPCVVQFATDAGIGANLKVRLGGKCGPMSGDPLDLTVTVMGLAEDHSQTTPWGQPEPLGRSAWLHTDGIDILVISRRAQIFGLDAFTGVGISLANRRLVVAKSGTHYQAAFTPVSDHIWSVATPGTLAMDLANMPYTKRARTYFPHLEDPWAEQGEPVAQIKRGRFSPLVAR